MSTEARETKNEGTNIRAVKWLAEGEGVMRLTGSFPQNGSFLN